MKTLFSIGPWMACMILLSTSLLAADEESEMVLLNQDTQAGGEASAEGLSVTMTFDTSFDSATASSLDGSMVARPGLTGQLYDVVGAQLPNTDLPENQSTRLSPLFLLDDGTHLQGWQSVSDWFVQSGPITSIHEGLVQTKVVYQDAPALIELRVGGVIFDFALQIKNTHEDDFGIYAGDDLDDSWQVQKFGENNPQGLAAADPDGDGQANHLEFLTGTEPTLTQSRFETKLLGLHHRTFRMQLSSIKPGTIYSFWRTTDLVHWEKVSEISPASEMTDAVLDLPCTQDLRNFFRVEFKRAF